MRVLIGCEFSGVVRRAFRELGHDAWSCDLLPAEDNSPYHIQGNVLDVLKDNWQLAIFHPPCTYLCSSGLHWNKRVEGRSALTEQALEFVRLLLDAPIAKIALENPIGCIGTRIRKSDQIIQPYQFGDNASKATCLWLKGLPALKHTGYVEPRMVAGKRRWANQADCGRDKFSPSPTRGMERSRTFPGIAAALAQQWGTQIIHVETWRQLPMFDMPEVKAA